MSVWLREFESTVLETSQELPLVLVVSWVKCLSSGMSTRSCRIRYVMTARDLALRSRLWQVDHSMVLQFEQTLNRQCDQQSKERDTSLDAV